MDPPLDPTRSIYISNFSHTFAASNIYEVFSPFGFISRIVLLGNDNHFLIYDSAEDYFARFILNEGLQDSRHDSAVHFNTRAMVEFRDQESACKAIYAMDKRRLGCLPFRFRVGWLTSKPTTPDVQPPSPPSKVLYVGNVRHSYETDLLSATEAKLRNVLAHHGLPSPRRIAVSPQRTWSDSTTRDMFAYLEFDSVEDANIVYKAINETDVSMHGRLLWSSFSKTVNTKILSVDDLPALSNENDKAQLEHDIRCAFQQAGFDPLVRYEQRRHQSVMKPPGFANVGFRSVEEARKAREIVGIQIDVRGQPRTVFVRAFELDTPLRTLRLSGLAIPETNRSMHQYMDGLLRILQSKGWNPVEVDYDGRQGPSRGVVYAHFMSTEEATEAKNMSGGGLEIGSRLIIVDYAKVGPGIRKTWARLLRSSTPETV